MSQPLPEKKDRNRPEAEENKISKQRKFDSIAAKTRIL
jgi:hypothetical protein